MSKTKKRKRTHKHQTNGGYKIFLHDLSEALKQLKLRSVLNEIPNNYKRMMYDYRIKIPNPVANSILISKSELKKITQRTKAYYKELNIEVDGKKFSAYQMMLIHCFFSVRIRMAKKDLGEDDTLVSDMKEVSDKLFTQFYSHYILGFFRIITQLGNADFKYFGVHIRSAAIFKENPCMELITKIYGIPAQKKTIQINGHFRPVFRLGKAVATSPPIEWIQIEADIVKSIYCGQKQRLDVYIQSHALKRLSQRLDLLNKEAINYILWENTHTINDLLIYKGYLLLPFYVYKIKVGYLLADIIDNELIFKTFLFITHNFTPEGDKLKEISGLSKQDISYWKIDRLSTYIPLNKEDYPELMQLFKDADLDELSLLKNKNFDVETIQSSHLQKLANYIQKGKNIEEIQQMEADIFLAQ